MLRLSIISLVLLSWSAFGNTYTGNGADDLWNTAANWSQGVPVQGASNQWADMTVDGTICTIDSTHVGANAASAGGVYPGCYGGDNEMYMTGGELTCSYFNAGRGDSDSGGNGYFQMTGGTVNTQGLEIPNQWASGSGNIAGHVDLHGGTINVTGWFSMGSRISGASGGGIGSMDVGLGTLIADGDQQTKIQGYIDDGWITAFGGAGYFQLDYNTRNAGKTTLTAGNDTQASNPDPAHEAEGISTNPVLSWTAGNSAESHNVYFGTTDPPSTCRSRPTMRTNRSRTATTHNPASTTCRCPPLAARFARSEETQSAEIQTFWSWPGPTPTRAIGTPTKSLINLM